MPCQSYESSWANDSSSSEVRRLKKEADKLARIACAALTELERVGKAEFLVLKNEELRDWWEAHKEADRKEQARVAELERRERVKKEALDRLTQEEKELLGLTESKKKLKDPDLPAPEYNEVELDINSWDKEAEYSYHDLKTMIDILRK